MQPVLSLRTREADRPKVSLGTHPMLRKSHLSSIYLSLPLPLKPGLGAGGWGCIARFWKEAA